MAPSGDRVAIRPPGEMAAVLRRAAARVVPELEVAVGETMSAAVVIAHGKVGEYQPGWPPLSEETERRKMYADRTRENGGGGGYMDRPLERSGELKESFYSEQIGLTGWLKSSKSYIVYSELGTAHEPPRPLLRESVREAMREVGINRLRFALTRVLE